MVTRIIVKEIRGNILSLRFTISVLLIVALFATGGFVFVGDYQQQVKDYWIQTNKNLEALSERTDELYKLAFYEQAVWKKPNPLSLCAGSFEKVLPNNFKFDVFKTDYPQAKGRSNFLVESFGNIDWTFIIAVILSFMASLLTYDSICGEKETGTLRLMLAGPIPRAKLVLSKYLSAMFTLGIALMLGLVVNLIIVVSSTVVEIGVGHWLKIMSVILLSFLYLSIFLLAGIFVSSRTQRSVNSMVIILFIWVSLVTLIPSFGRIVADTFCKVPTRVELDRRRAEAVAQVVKNAESGKYGKSAGSFTPDLTSPLANPPARARFDNALVGAKNRVFEDHHSRMLAQAFVGRNVTCISPTVVYQRASETITGTGVKYASNLYQQIKRYQDELEQFIRDKDQQDPDSLHLLSPFRDAVKYWGTVSKKPVDFDSVPKFQERDLALGESLQLAIWDIGLLVLFNLVFFTAAFVSFLKYDVR